MVCPTPLQFNMSSVYKTIKTYLLRVLVVLPYQSWCPPACTREFEERIGVLYGRLWKSHEGCHCRELARTLHLYLVCKVGCKAVIVLSPGKGRQSLAGLHRHPQGCSPFGLSWIAWLPTLHRLGGSVPEPLDQRWDQATAYLASEMTVCHDRSL